MAEVQTQAARSWVARRSAWFEQVATYDLEKLRRQVRAGANVDWRDPSDEGRCAMIRYAKADYVWGVNWLLGQGARVGLSDKFGECPLTHAARAGSVQVVKALIKAGADPRGSAGLWSPLVALKGSARGARAIVEAFSRVCGKGVAQEALRQAAYDGDQAKARMLVEVFELAPSWVRAAGKCRCRSPWADHSAADWLGEQGLAMAEAKEIAKICAAPPPLQPMALSASVPARLRL